MEDQFESLNPDPSVKELLIGSILLLLIMARTAVILHSDGILFALPPLAGLSLGLICQPLSKLKSFRDPLLCLMLIPAFALLMRMMPEEPISLITAQGAGMWLGILGLEVLVQGRNVFLQGGGVEVLGACNGLDMMAQILCIGIIFLLAFPVRSWKSRFFLIFIAPFIGLVCNTFRIAVLAGVVSSGNGKGTDLFEFFHTDGGSLIFSGIGVFVFGIFYMRLLERELPPIQE